MQFEPAAPKSPPLAEQRKRAFDAFRISELNASRNRRIDQATKDFVNQWLDIYRMGV